MFCTSGVPRRIGEEVVVELDEVLLPLSARLILEEDEPDEEAAELDVVAC